MRQLSCALALGSGADWCHAGLAAPMLAARRGSFILVFAWRKRRSSMKHRSQLIVSMSWALHLALLSTGRNTALALLTNRKCVFTWEGSRALGKMALTGLSRGDRQAFSLECLCFSAIWGEPGNGQQTTNVSLSPSRYQKNKATSKLLHPSTLKNSLALALAQLIIPCRLYWRAEGTFIRAPPAASSFPTRRVGAFINVLIYILFYDVDQVANGGRGVLTLSRGQRSVISSVFHGGFSPHSSACSIFHGRSFNILFLPPPVLRESKPINPRSPHQPDSHGWCRSSTLLFCSVRLKLGHVSHLWHWRGLSW